MNKIKDIIMSGTEPSVKENGWLVPNKDGKLELKFFGPNGWETVSSGGSDGDSNIYILPEPEYTTGAEEVGAEVTNWTKEMVEEALKTQSQGGVILLNIADIVLSPIFVQRETSNDISLISKSSLVLPSSDYSERYILGIQYIEYVWVYSPITEKAILNTGATVGNSLQHYFEVDDTLYLTHAEDNTFDPDTLGIKDGGVTLAKLAPDVPIYQPPKITLSDNPKKGDVISNWTRDVWDRVNNIELQSIKINNATYWTGQKSTDKLSAICSYSAIQNDTLGVIYIQIDLAWDTATNQTKITEYIQSTNKAIQTPTLPTIKTLPDFEEGITEWTAADFNACRNGFKNTPKVYHQVFIEGKLYIPIWVSNNEEEDDDIILGSMETTTDNLINTAQVRVRLKGGNVYFWNKTSHVGAGCVTRIFDDQNAPKLVGFLGDVANFQDSYGVDPSVLFYTEGTLTVKGYWFNNVDLVSLTAVSCTQTDTYSKAIFSDGTNIVTVYHEYDPDDQITITSTPVLTEGQAPTMTQFDALSTQVGNIDTVLTQIMGE